jgi:integrase
MSVHDRWEGNRTGQGARWEVRWREAGKQYKMRFTSRTAADRFDAGLKIGEQKSEDRSRKLTVDQLMQDWFDTKAQLKPKTLDAYRADMREVTDAFGDRLAAGIKPSEVRRWAARDRGVSLRRRSLVALRQAYRMAVDDGQLKSNPTNGVALPTVGAKDARLYLSRQQLGALADAAGEYAPMVWLLGTCGLRLGEAVGLQHGDVDRKRRRIIIRRSVVITSQGKVEGRPKTGKTRDVPVPKFVLDMLPKGEAGGWLFRGSRGGMIDAHSWRVNVFQVAAAQVGLGKITRGEDGVARAYEGLHPHELRHTAASLAIAAGADVLKVQRMLGHANPSITLSIYSHLWDEGLDELADRMHQAYGDDEGNAA